MKKFFLAAACALALSVGVRAQDMVQPEFVGGQNAMRAWVAENLQAPAEAGSLANPRVKVTFSVQPDGSLADIVVNDDVPQSVKDECVRLLQAMPAWTPGKLNGEVVAVTTTSFINFRPGKGGGGAPRPMEKDSVDAKGNVWAKPQFQGGRTRLIAYLTPYLVVDPHFKDYDKRHGAEVTVEFKVAKDGKVSDAKVLKSTYKELNKKSVDIINGMPKWTPGTKNGKPEEMKHTLTLKYN